MSRTRLDQELVSRRFFATRNAARNAIKAGLVRVDGRVVLKPAWQVDAATPVEVDAEATHYVGRGAHKLVAALDAFPVAVAGKSAIDVGASTGGFTQVLLEAGAASVTALDVGRNQLDPAIRSDRRVTACEGTNIRDVTLDELGGPFDIVTADLSFISLGIVAGDLARVGGSEADWIVLVKPQYEVGRRHIGKDGVVRDRDRRGQAAVDVVAAFARVGLVGRDMIKSPLLGGSGNVEALLWLRRKGKPIVSLDAFKVLAND